MKVLFHRNYDHRWTSRAVTSFKAGWSGRVKREVGQAAVPKYATEISAGDNLGDDATPETPDMAATGRMAGADGDDDGGRSVQLLGDALAGERQ